MHDDMGVDSLLSFVVKKIKISVNFSEILFGTVETLSALCTILLKMYNFLT